MTYTFNYSIDEIFAEIEKLSHLQKEHEEQALAEMITKYDFIVGSEECKRKLSEILPDGANIIFSPYIESPITVYVIKKFDIMDLLTKPYESEEI